MTELPEDLPVFANFQYEIYGAGLSGQVPELPIGLADLEAAAAAHLEAGPRGYVFGGAGTEATMTANRAAFARWEIVPRMLRDVSVRDLSSTLLGTPLPSPVLLAPIGVQSIVHPEAELAVARAAVAQDVPFVLSSASSYALEEVAQAAGDGRRWFQLYWPKSRELAASFVHRAEAERFEAIVVTLDTWLLAWRPRDLQGAYLPFLRGEGIATYLTDPVFRAALETTPEEDPGAAIGHWAMQFSNPAVTWDDLAWLREQTSLPLVLKGILHPDDALRAVEAGADAVLVSNHGGRQVDGAIASLTALPGIRDAVGEHFPVLLDSGIRSGADVFKALCLGADAVLLGRPFMWGLALAGQAGVEHVLRCLQAELDLTFALSGHTRLDELHPGVLAPAP